MKTIDYNKYEEQIKKDKEFVNSADSSSWLKLYEDTVSSFKTDLSYFIAQSDSYKLGMGLAFYCKWEHLIELKDNTENRKIRFFHQLQDDFQNKFFFINEESFFQEFNLKSVRIFANDFNHKTITKIKSLDDRIRENFHVFSAANFSIKNFDKSNSANNHFSIFVDFTYKKEKKEIYLRMNYIEDNIASYSERVRLVGYSLEHGFLEIEIYYYETLMDTVRIYSEQAKLKEKIKNIV